jgi:cbb3-type cytochrome oxidase cytochrome c subunit
MNRRLLAVLALMLLVSLLGTLFTACGGAQDETAVPAKEQEKDTPAALEGKALIQERCTKCHDLGRVEQAKKTEEEWKTTVERMVTKGAELSQTEQELVIRYLTDTYPQ